MRSPEGALAQGWRFDRLQRLASRPSTLGGVSLRLTLVSLYRALPSKNGPHLSRADQAMGGDFVSPMNPGPCFCVSAPSRLIQVTLVSLWCDRAPWPWFPLSWGTGVSGGSLG